jgi:N-acyl-D-aspartate/D-glutamate deacylase
VVINPQRLDGTLDSYHEANFEAYGGLSRMVNRNDKTVDAVFVSGRAVFRDGQATEVLGRERTGGFLRGDGRPRNVPRPSTSPVTA